MSRLTDLLGRGRPAVVGMVQLPPLAGGAPWQGETIEDAIRVAVAEATILDGHGIDAVMVQNLGDLPVGAAATPAQIAWMTRVTTEVSRVVSCPVGLNMLENDAEAMLAVASATGADFVRVKVYVGAMLTPFGVCQGAAHAAIRARNACGVPGVAILADVHDRTGTPLASGGFDEDVAFALRLGLADGLVITGKSHAQTLDMTARVRADWPDARVLIGGGVTCENFAEAMQAANGAIVSTSMKDGTSAVGTFVPAKVQDMMEAARQEPRQ